MSRKLVVMAGVYVCALTTPLTAQNYATRVAATDGAVFVAEPANIARPGMIYVYRAGADGRWTESAKIVAPNAANGDGFGAALAADGNTLLASRLRDREGRGTVFVFERRGDAWQSAGTIEVADAAANDSVGVALAVRGDVALLSSTRGNAQAGTVYVFRRSGGRWQQEAKLTAADGQPGDRFGAALAVGNDRILIGAPAQAKARGGAYLFLRESSGSWKQEGALVSRTVKDGDGLGTRVAFFNDLPVVAAPQRDENTGAVYIFEKNRSGPGYAAYTRLFPFDASSQSRFGSELAAVGTELWIGSPGADGFTGTIYRFPWDAQLNDFRQNRKLSFPGGRGGAGFAAAFAATGNVGVAGMPGDDNGEGTAVILARNPQGEWETRDKVWSEQESFERVAGRPVSCNSGRASNFDCGNVELLSFVPIKELGGKRGIQLNDIWGWTDPTTNREYALVGRTDGTSFVDITDASNPVYLGDLPMTEGATVNAWRDIKVYKDHAYIVADGAGKHGMQVFDLTRLRNVRNAPATFKADVTYDGIFSAHNIVINEDKGVAFAVGSNGGGETCGGGSHMIDIKDPKKPRFVGCFADVQTGQARTGYTHDSQCVTYKGPDEKYKNREVCFGSNETALSIADVSDKAKPVPISRAGYPNVQYSHQGWLTEDQRFFYMNDEGDEIAGVTPRTRTIIWDVSDLDDPQVVGEFLSPTAATDHNLFIKGDLMFQSHYVAGLRIVDISDRKNPREIGFFDSVPNSPNSPGFNGSWSNYPFFKSGTVVFTSGREGLFVVRQQRPIS
jgi:choice-of-anchor B domain-containing protein